MFIQQTQDVEVAYFVRQVQSDCNLMFDSYN